MSTVKLHEKNHRRNIYIRFFQKFSFWGSNYKPKKNFKTPSRSHCTGIGGQTNCSVTSRRLKIGSIWRENVAIIAIFIGMVSCRIYINLVKNKQLNSAIEFHLRSIKILGEMLSILNSLKESILLTTIYNFKYTS